MTDEEVVLDELYWAQALDRAYVAARFAEEHLQEFEVFKQVPTLKARVDHIVEALYDLYQSIPKEEDDYNGLRSPEAIQAQCEREATARRMEIARLISNGKL